MAYKVVLTPQAIADADRAAEYIRQFAPETATRWFDRLLEAILSLTELPKRCPLAPETATLGMELRQLFYGKRRGTYRIVFRIYEETPGEGIVRVVAIRHGARDRIDREALDSEEREV